MKVGSQVALPIKCALEFLDPLLASMIEEDHSSLFIIVAPGMAREVSARIEAVVHELTADGWWAGQRGCVVKSLVNVLGHLQQACRVPDGNEAAAHVLTARNLLSTVLADTHRIAAARRFRRRR
jgi:hypothetical protein